MPFAGELVFTWLFDLGGEVRLGEAAKLLANVPAAEPVSPTKSAPPYLELVRPYALRYPEEAIVTEMGEHLVGVEAHLYAIGAVGVALRLPFDLPSLEDVNRLSHLRPTKGPDLAGIARAHADRLRAAIEPAIIETYPVQAEPESYLSVVLTRTEAPAQDLLREHPRLLAGIVAGERVPQRLSDTEVGDNLRTRFSYYEDDLVIVDWDRALIVEPSGRYDDVLTVIEAANLELLELRVYDRYLDNVLENAYDDISRFYGRGGLFRSARVVQEDLSGARIDLVRVTDSINNIGKIFGDYYLAKLHLGLAERFHLAEWELIVREKMATLSELYTLASHEVEHRRGLVLETMVVLLFVIDVGIIVLTALRR